MADVVWIDIQILKLRGSDATERDNFVAWKKIEESYEHR